MAAPSLNSSRNISTKKNFTENFSNTDFEKNIFISSFIFVSEDDGVKNSGL